MSDPIKVIIVQAPLPRKPSGRVLASSAGGLGEPRKGER